MPVVTKIASHPQDGADAPLALLTVWMVVGFRVTRLKMFTITSLAMLMIGMILTRTCGGMEEQEVREQGAMCRDLGIWIRSGAFPGTSRIAWRPLGKAQSDTL